MKNRCQPFIVAMCLVVLGGGLSAQRVNGEESFGDAVRAEVVSQEEQFLAVAEAMPEGQFGFSPEKLQIEGSTFKDVRSFAMQVRHVAADNFAIWAPLTDKPEPASLSAPNGPPEMTSRAEILRFLRESFVYSRAAAATITSTNAVERVRFRGRQVTRLSLFALAVTHMGDHYGQLVEYLRLVGVVPPASRPRTAGK